MTDYFLVSAEELNEIKNDCAHPEKLYCEGCEYAGDPDDTRASALGCNFKGANALMEEVMTHPLEAELQKDREKVINLIERFIKVAIAICDEPHGELSNPAGVKGMKSSLTILKGVVNQCRTDEGMSQLEEHLNKEVE